MKYCGQQFQQPLLTARALSKPSGGAGAVAAAALGSILRSPAISS
jgi:hypothetical protein